MQLNFMSKGGQEESDERTFTEADLRAASEKAFSLSTSGLVDEGIDLSKEFRCELFLVASGASIMADALVKGYSDDDIAKQMVNALKRYGFFKVMTQVFEDPDWAAEVIKKCKAERDGD